MCTTLQLSTSKTQLEITGQAMMQENITHKEENSESTETKPLMSALI